jgi:hypothetical protein
MGRVEDDAIVDDLAIVAEGARVGGREILLYDEIARAQPPERILRPARAGILAAAARHSS